MTFSDPAVLVWGPLLLLTALTFCVLVLLIWRQRKQPKRAAQRAGAGISGALVISAARR